MDINNINDNILKLVTLSNTINTLLSESNDGSLVKKHLLEMQVILKTSIDNILKKVDINIHYIESLKLHDQRDKLVKNGIKTEDDERELGRLNERLTFLYCENMDYLSSKSR